MDLVLHNNFLTYGICMCTYIYIYTHTLACTCEQGRLDTQKQASLTNPAPCALRQGLKTLTKPLAGFVARCLLQVADSLGQGGVVFFQGGLAEVTPVKWEALEAKHDRCQLACLNILCAVAASKSHHGNAHSRRPSNLSTHPIATAVRRLAVERELPHLAASHGVLGLLQRVDVLSLHLQRRPPNSKIFPPRFKSSNHPLTSHLETRACMSSSFALASASSCEAMLNVHDPWAVSCFPPNTPSSWACLEAESPSNCSMYWSRSVNLGSEGSQRMLAAAVLHVFAKERRVGCLLALGIGDKLRVRRSKLGQGLPRVRQGPIPLWDRPTTSASEP